MFICLALHKQFQLPFEGIYCWQLTYVIRRIIPVLKSLVMKAFFIALSPMFREPIVIGHGKK